MEHKILTILALAFLFSNSTNGKVKDPDEDRAYEFGFTIEGMQHRHEKKDVNGIIQGEFGFITADGVYHVTVYATDENGNFRILSMKNIKVSPPLDGSPDFGSKKYSQIPVGSQMQPQQPTTPKTTLQHMQVQKRTDISTTKAPYKPFTLQPTVKPACAGCGYVTTTKAPPVQPVDRVNQITGPHTPNVNSVTGPGTSPAIQSVDQLTGPKVSTLSSDNNQEFPPVVQSVDAFNQQRGSDTPKINPYGQSVVPSVNNVPNVNTGTDQKFLQATGSKTEPPRNSNTLTGESELPDCLEQVFATPDTDLTVPGVIKRRQSTKTPCKTPSNLDGAPNENPTPGIPVQSVPAGPKVVQHTAQITNRNSEPPVRVSNGVIQIPGNPDVPIKDKYPGMVDGLPAGINEKDISDILYRFNWTVGFQGHYETGYKNGAKVGGYFVNGSDGINRVVTYVADEFGYRPKVRITNVGLDSPDTPKDDKTFELKSFEFVWYPVK